MSNNEQKIEQEIQDKGLNAPRLTPDYIDSVISGEHYFTAYEGTQGCELEHRRSAGKPIEVNPISAAEKLCKNPLKLLTFCILVLKNGFTVTGESACASPENFNADIGKEIAYDNAREKIWMLEGYLLKEKLHQSTQPPKNHIERVIEEKRELDTKLNALTSFLTKIGTDAAPMLTDDQVGYLEEQQESMQGYSDILGVRIEYDTQLLKDIGLT